MMNTLSIALDNKLRNLQIPHHAPAAVIRHPLAMAANQAPVHQVMPETTNQVPLLLSPQQKQNQLMTQLESLMGTLRSTQLQVY